MCTAFGARGFSAVVKKPRSVTLTADLRAHKGVVRRAAALTFDFHFWSSHPSSAVRLFP